MFIITHFLLKTEIKNIEIINNFDIISIPMFCQAAITTSCHSNNILQLFGFVSIFMKTTGFFLIFV